MALPWSTVARRRVRRPARLQHRRGHEHQRGRLRHGVSAAESGPDADAARRPARRRVPSDRMRAFSGYSSINAELGSRLDHAPLAAGVASSAGSETACRSASTTRSDSRASGARRPRIEHDADGTFIDSRRSGRSRRAVCRPIRSRHIMKANFVWDMPDLQSDQTRAPRPRLRHQRLAVVGRSGPRRPAVRIPWASATRAAAAA